MATSQRHSKRSAAANPTTPTAVTKDPAAAVTLGARRVATALAGPGAARSRDEWLTVVGDCQSLINTLTAVQDAAIAEAARRESVWCEDGTLGEAVHAPGRVTLEAADVLAPVIGATHQQAQRRVEQAVRLAARRVPVPADARDLPDASGLGGLHEAMAAGHLDGYRAGVIAFELDVAPADVADAVVAALDSHLGEDSTSLRRRTRVLLSRISPDLVRQRAQKARNNTGLRRWVAEPGVDEWHGTFPSEDAATAWAAIDRLAHDLVANSTCTSIEQARGKALTDLVTGNATIDVQIVLTVPADTQPASATDQTTVADTELHAPASAAVAGFEPHAPVPADSQRLAPGTPDATVSPVSEPDAPTPAVSSGGEHSNAPTAAAAGASAGLNTDQCAVTSERARLRPPNRGWSGRARLRPPVVASGADEPGSDQPVLSADSAQDTSATAAERLSTPAVHTDNLVAPENGSDDDLVQVQGSRPSEPLLVRRTWLRDHLRKQPPQLRRRARQAPPRFVPCDPLTGARLDPRDDLATDAYRPRRRARRPGQGPRRPLPLPRLLRRRQVLRPRPRTTLADRAHHRHQPAHPLPAPPPHQTTTRLATCAWHPTVPPPGPTPPGAPAPPHPSTP